MPVAEPAAEAEVESEPAMALVQLQPELARLQSDQQALWLVEKLVLVRATLGALPYLILLYRTYACSKIILYSSRDSVTIFPAYGEVPKWLKGTVC